MKFSIILMIKAIAINKILKVKEFQFYLHFETLVNYTNYTVWVNILESNLNIIYQIFLNKWHEKKFE